jgi:hypothetical protein
MSDLIEEAYLGDGGLGRLRRAGRRRGEEGGRRKVVIASCWAHACMAGLPVSVPPSPVVPTISGKMVAAPFQFRSNIPLQLYAYTFFLAKNYTPTQQNLVTLRGIYIMQTCTTAPI